MPRRNRCTAKLRLYPDPVLKVVCEPVGDDEDVSGIIRDMLHILTNSKTGMGLAAPQAGYTKRVIMVSFAGFYETMIHPHIVARSDDMVIRNEGCLSYPGIYKNIERHVWINVHYRDENDKQQTGIIFDMDARIIQHEIDHLNGKCKVGD